MIVMQRVWGPKFENLWPVLSVADGRQICISGLGLFSELNISTSNCLLDTFSLGNPRLFIEYFLFHHSWKDFKLFFTHLRHVGRLRFPAFLPARCGHVTIYLQNNVSRSSVSTHILPQAFTFSRVAGWTLECNGSRHVALKATCWNSRVVSQGSWMMHGAESLTLEGLP